VSDMDRQSSVISKTDVELISISREVYVRVHVVGWPAGHTGPWAVLGPSLARLPVWFSQHLGGFGLPITFSMAHTGVSRELPNDSTRGMLCQIDSVCNFCTMRQTM